MYGQATGRCCVYSCIAPQEELLFFAKSLIDSQEAALLKILLIPFLLFASVAFGQSKTKVDNPDVRGLFDGSDTDHIFPQFANGPVGGGNYYRSTISVLPFITSTTAINCALKTYGS